MTPSSKLLWPLLAALVVVAPATLASADFDDWTEVPEYTGSPEHFGFELRVGIYEPLGLGASFSSPEYFGGDDGPLLGVQLHYFPFRIDFLGLIGIGGGFSWSQWSTSSPGGIEGDRNVFEAIWMDIFLVWRIDTLARYLNVPIVVTPKIGWDFAHWLTSLGGEQEAEGWAMGPRFAGKVSLELDFLEPRAARQLDEEWGINHSELFFEAYYSMTGIFPGELPMTGWAWVVGIGFTF